MKEPGKPKVGILALTLELYESMAPDLRPNREGWIRERLMPALSGEAEVWFEGARYRAEDVEACVEGFEARGADCLLVVLLSYAASQVSLPALRRTRLPILIWNTQELFTVDASYGLRELFHNHAVHGTQDLANVLRRAEVPFRFVTGHVSDREAMAELTDCFRAAGAVHRLRRSRLGLLGYPFPGMGDFAVDTTHLLASLGCAWTPLALEVFLQRAAAATAEAVAELVAAYRRDYEVAADVTAHDLESSARVELALADLVREHRLDGFSFQFLALGDDERCPTLPFVASSRLMAAGLGFAGEGDLLGAAGHALLQWLQPPATFSEMFTIDFGGNAVLMSHMGEANVAMARRDRKVRLVARPVPITRTRDGQLALVTSLEPGPATFFALAAAPHGRWRFMASAVRILDFGPLDSLCVPHFKLAPTGDVRAFLTRYAEAGGPHHNAVCFGDARRRVRLAAEMLNVEYTEI